MTMEPKAVKRTQKVCGGENDEGKWRLEFRNSILFSTTSNATVSLYAGFCSSFVVDDDDILVNGRAQQTVDSARRVLSM